VDFAVPEFREMLDPRHGRSLPVPRRREEIGAGHHYFQCGHRKGHQGVEADAGTAFSP